MRRFLILLPLFGVFFALTLRGSDEEANAYIREAESLKKDKSFVSAAEKYLAAAKFADTPVIQANAIQNASLCYRNAKLYGKEFDCLERLLKQYISFVDFERAVMREYEIANDFYNGHRDVVYSWLPFIKDADRTTEIYEAALKNAACTDLSPEARLRLGDLYLTKNETEKAIAAYRQILTLHAGTREARYAALELARLYLERARRGDGDGAWTRMAMAALKDFLEKHPNDPEAPWAKKALDEVNALDAARVYALGRYYHRTGRDDLARRYLVRVIRTHGASEQSIPSERLLAEIDKTYVPPDENAPREAPYEHKFDRHTIPMERNPIMVVPENSEGKWLLPIRDLAPDIHVDSREAVPPGKVDLNDF